VHVFPLAWEGWTPADPIHETEMNREPFPESTKGLDSMADTYRALLQSGGLSEDKETVEHLVDGKPLETIVEVFDVEGEPQERVWKLVVPVTPEPVSYELVGDAPGEVPN
jgi:hypothetical protein